MTELLSPADANRDEASVNLSSLLTDLSFDPTEAVVVAESGSMTLAELRWRVAALAERLRSAGVTSGTPIGNLVSPGVSGIVAMFACWAAGGVYVPINRRYTPAEVSALLTETSIALVIGSPADLAAHELPTGAVSLDPVTADAAVRRPVDPGSHPFDAEIALVLRTSGTTGRPKAVLLRHAGTLAALDASLAKLRRGGPKRGQPGRPVVRRNLIPVSLALWAGVFNTLFSFRAGFGVVLLDRFSPHALAAAVRKYHITSTVLPPAMITMLADSHDIADLAPLRLVRSITAPLSAETARRFYQRFGVFVLNSYGQTELGGEVVGWTADDLRTFGETKLGAAGRPYDNIDVRICSSEGEDVAPGELGEIHIRSPFRMRGYASLNAGGNGELDGRLVDGYLGTGDVGRLDTDGFLWIEGRVSDVINRGGLKVMPEEVEEALRRHPSVLDAGVAGVPDSRLGETPHAWIIVSSPVPTHELEDWCRRELAPYKVPTGYTEVTALPRSDIGKLLRRELVATFRG